MIAIALVAPTGNCVPNASICGLYGRYWFRNRESASRAGQFLGPEPPQWAEPMMTSVQVPCRRLVLGRGTSFCSACLPR